MNSHELLDLIGEARTKYIQQALDSRGASLTVKKRSPRKRALLIAAAIAAALLLVGCAVAVVSSLQNRKMGETTWKEYFDSQGNRITPTEITVDIINLHGAKDTPQYKAQQEWDAWNETYVPDPSQVSCENEQGIPENLYGVYGCYTMEMADKLTEILDKYDLKPLDTGFGICEENIEDFCEAYSIDGICHEDGAAKVEKLAGWGYICGAMDFEWSITPAGGRGILVEIEYTPKDYYAPGGCIWVKTGTFEEWAYTTADGSPVQIAMSPDRAFLFREQENANIYVAMDCHDGSFTREEVEQFADIINFQVSPQPPADGEGFKAQMREKYDRWQSETYALPETEAPSYDSYGDFLKESYTGSVPDSYYALWDLDGDGAEELLIGNGEGGFYSANTIKNGAVVDMLILGEPFRVCEGGVLAMNDGFGFCHIFSYGMPHPRSFTVLDRVDYRLDKDQWYDNKESEREGTPITQAEADAIRAKYTPIEIPVKPLKDYPIDDQGTTLGEYITKNIVPTTEEGALEVYREFLEKRSEGSFPYTYYRLLDLDGDGIPELFAGRDAELFDGVYKVVNGKIWMLPIADSLFCEGGIYRRLQRSDIADSYEFRKVENGKMVLIDIIQYSAVKDAWGRSADGDYILDEILTPEEAQAVLDSYKIIPSGMKPISQFPAK